MIWAFVAVLLTFSTSSWAQNESCIDVVKGFLSSSEFNDPEKNLKINQACIDVDPKCVNVVGDSLRSSERNEAEKFLPLVASCAGVGKADCYNAILEQTPSFDRSTAAQAVNLMKKCQK